MKTLKLKTGFCARISLEALSPRAVGGLISRERGPRSTLSNLFPSLFAHLIQMSGARVLVTAAGFRGKYNLVFWEIYLQGGKSNF